MEKFKRLSERVFDISVNHADESLPEKVSRLKIQVDEDCHYTITMDGDGGLIINKCDYINSSTIRIEPRVSNEISIK